MGATRGEQRFPALLAVVLGTGTAVGKTYVAAALAGELRERGLAVGARKPLQSGASGELSDAQVLAASTGEAVGEVCPPAWSYAVAMAPPMAAAVLARPCPDLSGVLAWIEPSRRDADREVLLVETVGGPRSPCCSDADSAALALALVPDALVLVADAGLGTVNAVRLSLEGLAASAAAHGRTIAGRGAALLAEGAGPLLAPGAEPGSESTAEPAATGRRRAPVPRSRPRPLPLLVHLNRYDAASDLHQRNRQWLHGCGIDTTVSIRALAASLLSGPTAAPDPPPPAT